MVTIITYWLINAVFLYVLSFLFSGIVIESTLSSVVAAIVLGLMNATIKPIIQIISFPIMLLTLGLFYLVINGLILLMVSALVPGFYVSGFGTAFFGGIVLSILNTIFYNMRRNNAV
ncbi:MAG: phage holin family protein [Defluviitaleaceae bacterium]|nr:phage holin family protein [Defluviitaleaceae bacterium]